MVVERYGISEQTAWKWRERDSVQDLNQTSHRLQTTLSPAQEAVVVTLRTNLLFPLDDFLPFKIVDLPEQEIFRGLL